MKQEIYAFNRGIVSEFALGRRDQQRLALSAQTMTNMISRVLGPMTFRPGTAYLGATASNAAARFLGFIFATNDVALVEVTNLAIRIWISDALMTRASVTSSVTNGTFSGNITGWTDGSDSGGVADYEATNHLRLVSNGTARALAYQAVTTSSGSTEHALRIVVATGPVLFKVGSALDGDDYVTETSLDEGTHSITFTPTGTYYVHFISSSVNKKLVDSCAVESSGTVSITAPWPAAALGNIRYDQQGDIIYVACDGYQEYKIERRGTRPNATGWSCAKYQREDGPFQVENTGPITLTPSATTGNITLASSTPLFKSSHVAALFSLTNLGQSQSKTAAAQNTFSDPILVEGLIRSFGITITGSLSAGSTVRLQSSTDNVTYSDVNGQSWLNSALPVSTSYDDTLLNQSIYYRIGIKTGEYTASDSVDMVLIYNAGSQRGIVRVTAFTNSKSVSAEVITELGAASATKYWQEGSWSTYQGFPTAVLFHEGRLWWFGRNKLIGSVSDSYDSFDEEVLGSSGPINRTLGSGPVDFINFALSLDAMIIGAQGREISVASSSIDSPLTPVDTNLKTASTQGSAAIDAEKLDDGGLYVHRNGIKIYQISLTDANYRRYSSVDLMGLCPEVASVGIVRMAIQRQPDTRIHCVLSNGTVVIGVYSSGEEILSWQLMTTDGTVEDVVILPATVNTTEDKVYYVVNRTINSSTVRYLEKWAREDECRGSTTSKNLDSHIVFNNGSPSTTVSGLTHLEGESVVVWADGAPVLDASNDPVTYTVTSGAITLDAAATTGVVGLSYTGQWKSTKIGYLFANRRISQIGLMLAYINREGISFGPDFTHLDPMPTIEEGTTPASAATSYEQEMIPINSTWATDKRICLQAKAPMPATFISLQVDVND